MKLPVQDGRGIYKTVGRVPANQHTGLSGQRHRSASEIQTLNCKSVTKISLICKKNKKGGTSRTGVLLLIYPGDMFLL